MCALCIPEAFTGRLRRAVPQIPPKSSVPRRLPFYNGRPFLSCSESALVEVLIPLHFNSPRISAYKKPGEGASPYDTKVLQLATIRKSRYWSHSIPHKPNPITHFCTLSITRGLYPFTQSTIRKRPAARPKPLPRFPQPSVCAYRATPATPFASCAYFTVLWIPRGEGASLGTRSRASLLCATSAHSASLRYLCLLIGHDAPVKTWSNNCPTARCASRIEYR
jgi:hypothetical protein